MKIKAITPILMAIFITTSAALAQTTGNAVTDAILNSYSAKLFTGEPVKDTDLDLILRCGIKAPSARNSQPWKFTVIKDMNLVADVMKNIPQGNVIVIVSGQEAAQPGINADFDCALAAANMYTAAQSLGLGAHIYAGPISNVNANKATYGIPDGYRAVTILRIGNIDKTADATSSASARRSFEETVIYK
ncbi:MAG TPA: nitroreductase family protein [Bacteroidales bacterium]|nr:nitroreductase family protein [Bacteroidales bacterium]